MYLYTQRFNYVENHILAKTETGKLISLGEVSSEYDYDGYHILGVDNWENPLDETLTHLYLPDSVGYHFDKLIVDMIIDKHYLATTPVDRLSFIKNEGRKQLVIVDKKHIGEFVKSARLVKALDYLTRRYPIYKRIVHEGELLSIGELLVTSEETTESFIDRLLMTHEDIEQTKQLIDEHLSRLSPGTVYDLKTQEEQVQFFLDMSKDEQKNVLELVTDDDIEWLKQSDVYKNVANFLTDRGFALSETQQFNSLQHLGLMFNTDERLFYNLSDMGSGKTLMTVESIILYMNFVVEQFKQNPVCDEHISTYYLPNINIIAPTLSLKSSWLNTFELFYPLTRVNDHHFTYQIPLADDKVAIGNIYLSGFTVKPTGVKVTNKLPSCKTHQDILIIDEIHQLTSRGTKPNKFITKSLANGYSIHTQYKTFVLSGTLANLTTHEWWSLITFLDIPDGTWSKSGSHTPSEYDKKYRDTISDMKATLHDTLRNAESKQRRTLDMTDTEVKHLYFEKLTNKEYYFHALYSPQAVDPVSSGNDAPLSLIKEGRCQIINSATLQAPNVELFYKLVSKTVVTAQSLQIAEELFGQQKTQHKATVIETTSQLTKSDLALMKRLHRIIKDVGIYKSKTIGTNLSNAMLNVNDGLAKQTIYDVLNKAANTSKNFLTYLSQMDVDLLKDIQGSNLILSPKLEDTEKFKVLKRILEEDKEETFLIVVNDATAVKHLSTALGIKHLSDKDMRDEVNYQELIDALYEEQSIVIVPQHMIKSSLDLVQANRLVQYQLNSEIADIIQTQNRINRIGQTRETKAYYIATDQLQNNIIKLFLETYQNIRVAHKGITELFVDMEKQVEVVSNYLEDALSSIDTEMTQVDITVETLEGDLLHVSAFDKDVYAERCDDRIIWLETNLVVKTEKGATLVGTVSESTSAPRLVTVKGDTLVNL